MDRKLIEALARAEAIADHPVTPPTCATVIKDLCERLRILAEAVDLAEREAMPGAPREEPVPSTEDALSSGDRPS